MLNIAEAVGWPVSLEVGDVDSPLVRVPTAKAMGHPLNIRGVETAFVKC